MVQLRVGVRRIRRHPGTFVAAISALALGIGAVTAVYAVLEQTLIRPVSGVSPDGLVLARQGEQPDNYEWYRYPDFQRLRTRQDLFAGVAAFGPLPRELLIGSGVTTVAGSAQMVSGNYFDVLGVAIPIGRPFRAADDHAAAPETAILAHDFWREHFGEDPAAIGRVIRVGRIAATVIGVAPASFRGTDVSRKPDVYLPLALMPQVDSGFEWFNDPRRSPMWLQIIARLRPGVSRSAANAALSAVDPTGQDRQLWYVRLTRLIDVQQGAIPPRLWTEFRTLMSLFALAAASLLLIACLTVGTLLLVRGEQRRLDLAVCLALGARRARLIGEVWSEALILTFLGGVLALPIAHALLRGLGTLTPGAGAIFAKIDMPVNPRILLAALATTVCVSGLVTAVSCRAIRETATDTLRTGGGPTLITRRQARRVLVLVQVACAMGLLVSTLLLVRSLSAMYAVELGYRSDGLVEVTVDTATVRPHEADRRLLFDTLDQALRTAFPFAALGQSAREWVGARPEDLIVPDAAARVVAGNSRGGPGVHVRTVSPGYLEALNIPVVQGRTFLAQDTAAGAPATAVVSVRLARLLAPDGRAVGKRLGPMAGEERPVVIGVVGDVRTGPLHPSRPTAYILIGALPEPAATSGIPAVAERAPSQTTYTIRTSEALAVGHVARRVLASWPGVNVTIITTRQRFEREAAPQRFGVAALGVLGAAAIALAMLSIFVLITSTVEARTRELGIRVALGASTPSLAILLATDTFLMVLAGLILGSAAMLSGARVLRSLLFGIQAADPISFSGAAALILSISVLVLTRPLLVASRLDPAKVLREP